MKPPPANAHVNRVIVLTLLLLVFSGTLGLGAVWVRQEISQTANRSRALEVRMADVERRLDEVNAEVAAAVNPDALLRQNEAMHLALVSPQEPQVVRVGEDPVLRLAAKRNRELFRLERAAPSAGDDFTFRVVNASLP
ncbi:MAG: hypothetical protein JNG83_06520 [Opitutaceae bacterium]|nr:hypothetical protein [Opitutaceae bacterium]